MIQSNKALFVLIFALGLWGCARVGPGETTEEDRIKALEAKVRKLEEDFQTAVAARDQFVQKLAAVEKDRNLLRAQLQTATQERDELRQNLTARTTERDSLQVQYDSFRKEIRSLLIQADAAVTGTPQPPVTATSPAPSPGKL